MTWPQPFQRVVIVGASLAGLTAAEALRQEGFDGEIVLIGDEVEEPYDRPPLSKQLLTGEWGEERLALRSKEEWAALELAFWGGRTAVGLDLEHRAVRLADGEAVGYDGLVIATGARPRPLPSTVQAAAGLGGVHTLRSRQDALRLRADFQRGGPAAVIGAGFIGAEVASSARALELPTALVEAQAGPLLGPLGAELSQWAAQLHRANGVDLRCNAAVAELVGSPATGRVEAIVLADGSRLAADVVVVGVGVRPNVEWLEGSGLSIGDGVICDQYCRAAPGVYAAGDAARWLYGRLTPFAYAEPQRTLRVEHWTNAVEQGLAAAQNLLRESRGEALEAFQPIPYFWSDQHGVSIMAAGVTSPRDDVRVVQGSLAENRFAALYGLRGKVSGVVAVGWPRMLRRYQGLIREGARWEEALEG